MFTYPEAFMSRWISRATTATALLGSCLALAATGCGTARSAPSGHQATVRHQDRTVLARGQAVSGLRWQLVAWDQDHRLGLDLESLSGHSYSGQVGFAASHDYSYYWGEGLGPGNSTFYYGPVPGSAVMVRLTAPGHRPLLIRTVPLPAGHRLPAGRFFVIQPPGTSWLNWSVTPLDAAGQQVAFRDF
jgi:hypothetical protein